VTSIDREFEDVGIKDFIVQELVVILMPTTVPNLKMQTCASWRGIISQNRPTLKAMQLFFGIPYFGYISKRPSY
jgi:hypothetical protein